MNFCSSSEERTPLRVKKDVNYDLVAYSILTEAGDTVILPAVRSPLSGMSIVKKSNFTFPVLVSVTTSLITLS